jgi:hypothetical protein
MKQRIFVLFALVALALAGCKHNPTSGTIYMKATTPAHDYTYTTMFCAAYGKYGCTVWVPIIQTEHIPQRWVRRSADLRSVPDGAALPAVTRKKGTET